MEVSHEILQQTFRSGMFTLAWLQSVIPPLHKNVHKNYPDNYRSVSLCNGSGNLYIHILNTRLADWVEEHGLINEAQAGFRRNYSTIDRIFGGTFLALVRRHSLTMVNYMLLLSSFQKAFDMVDSSCLWAILGKTGVRGKTFRAIQSMHDVVKSKSSCRWRLYGGFRVSWWFKAERSLQSVFLWPLHQRACC